MQDNKKLWKSAQAQGAAEVKVWEVDRVWQVAGSMAEMRLLGEEGQFAHRRFTYQTLG